MKRRDFMILGSVGLAGCAAPQVMTGQDAKIDALALDIANLGEVSPEEATRAATIAVTYPLELKRQYGVIDPPLVHNTKVNMGLRPRGLCWHWADDLQARLAQEQFETLALHRAIANATSLLIDHSTVVIAAKGDEMEQGLVLDPWRQSGDLFWSPVLQDPRYTWERRANVMARRR